MYIPTRSLAKSTPDAIISVSLEFTAISPATLVEQPNKVTPVSRLGLNPPSGTLRYLW